MGLFILCSYSLLCWITVLYLCLPLYLPSSLSSSSTSIFWSLLLSPWPLLSLPVIQSCIYVSLVFCFLLPALHPPVSSATPLQPASLSSRPGGSLSILPFCFVLKLLLLNTSWLERDLTAGFHLWLLGPTTHESWQVQNPGRGQKPENHKTDRWRKKKWKGEPGEGK